VEVQQVAGAPGLEPVDLAPLTHSPALELYEHTSFVRELKKRTASVRLAALAAYGRIFERNFRLDAKSGEKIPLWERRQKALVELEAELAQLRSGLAAYLAAELDETGLDAVFAELQGGRRTTGAGARAWGIALAGNAFPTAAPRGLLGAAVGELTRFEAQLAPAASQLALTTRTWRVEARAIYSLWFGLARVCLAVAVLDGLPYCEIWEGVYGNGGWLLAEKLSSLVDEVRRSRAFQALVASRAEQRWIERYATLGETASVAISFPLAQTLVRLEAEPALWRDYCRRNACRADERGRAHPFTFAEIPPELHAYPGLQGMKPDHMYALPAAQERVQRTKRLWDELLCPQIVALEGKPPFFRINAGSLEHGGAHPPHTAHRNGAMFDLGLGQPGQFPIPVCPDQAAIYGGEPEVSGQQEAELTPGESDIVKLLKRLAGRLFVLLEPEETGELPEGVRLLTKFCSGEFRFPRGGVATKAGRVIPWQTIAVRYTQTMLLTFPSQILFASWTVLREARADLLMRVEQVILGRAQEGVPADDDEGRALAFLRERFTPAPPRQRPVERVWGSRPQTRLLVAEDHADHWHVSYDPLDLERADEERELAFAWLENKARELWAEEATGRPAE
jgi:hypothetical protein